MPSLAPLLFILCLIVAISVAFDHVDHYLIDCGSSKNTKIDDGRTFMSDSKSFSMLSTEESIPAMAKSSANVPSKLYLTARIFTQKSSYSFDINRRGRHWIRLYFYAFAYDEYDLRDAVFSVETDGFVLLDSFSIGKNPFLFKEYLINLTYDRLSLRFSPANNSVAFVNAIEIVSAPDELISDKALAVDTLAAFNGICDYALETAYRVTMGGDRIDSLNDTLGRTWENDERFLFERSATQRVRVDPATIRYSASRVSPDIAPRWVYAGAEEMGDAKVSDPDFNVTWVFSVNPSFLYLIRMHFCDIVSSAMNQLYFNVYINDQASILHFDLSSLTSGLKVPYYKDFVGNASAGSKLLSVKIGPSDMRNVPVNAILNGLEIMKMSNKAWRLSRAYSLHGLVPGVRDSDKTSNVGLIVGSILGGIAVIGLLGLGYYYFCRSKRSSKKNDASLLPLSFFRGRSFVLDRMSSIGTPRSGLTPRNGLTPRSGFNSRSGSVRSGSLRHGSVSLCLSRFFTFAQILEATNNFDENLVLGVGGFGKVYKGKLEDGTTVAVKRGNSNSQQGLAEFQTEIQMLSNLRHRHLVSLIGYCEEQCEMILVYEYMANGPLRDHLYGAGLPILSWKQRLQICLGSARGLHYLHTGTAEGIIHRDVKTSNILLDEKLVAKVSDFGLSKTGPALDQTHVSTAVKGSFGYLDPEYFRMQQLTEKSDVYSFGIVMLEVLCARPAINPSLPKDQVNIAEWVIHSQKKGMLNQIIDPCLNGTINPESLGKFGETAQRCLADQGRDRPTMGDVLWNLEYILKHLETSTKTDKEENCTDHTVHVPLPLPKPGSSDNSIIYNSSSTTDKGSKTTTPSGTFTQLANPEGR